MIVVITALTTQELADKVSKEMKKGDTVQFMSERLAFVIKRK